MILYHFTSLFHLPGIVAAGEINRGDVPISPDRSVKAPWFTDDPTQEGTVVPSNVCKAGARISVAFNDRDPKLHKWTDLIQQWNIKAAFAETLDLTGGGGSDHWYIYQFGVPSVMWTDVAILNSEGGYTTVSTRALHFTDVVPNFTMQVKQRDIA